MKIDSTRGVSASGVTRRAGASGGDGFVLPTEEAAPASATAPARAVSAPGALFALQLEEGGRRQRQARRGAAALGLLDRLQAGLLSGADPGAELASLAQGLAQREPTGDVGLDGVLREIDVRTAVELAKRERRGAGRA
jgi:hypothetical protein